VGDGANRTRSINIEYNKRGRCLSQARLGNIRETETSLLKEIRNRLRRTPLFNAYKKVSPIPDYWFWKLRGSPGPRVPHLLKQRIIRDFGRRYGLKTLIETGTNFGVMIDAQKGNFERVYSIELEKWRHARAKQMFAGAANVTLLEGDSATVLRELLKSIDRPCLMWLDAHDGDRFTPIREELEAIADHPQEHVLLIDDACCFDGRNQYPKLEEIREWVERRYPGRVLEVADDVIRIYQPR
jgi:hypothetical protein